MAGVLLHILNDITVTVETAQGNLLHSNLPNAPHDEGDYLVCTIREDDGPDLSDIWILNGLIFLTATILLIWTSSSVMADITS